MNDKQFARFLFIMLALFLAWWLFHRRKSGTIIAPNGTPIGTYNDPQLLTYAANPAKFGPQTVNGSVNISVNGYNGLNQNYMPLFGFVGMAQGETYQ
jgi:hypothetical protein